VSSSGGSPYGACADRDWPALARLRLGRSSCCASRGDEKAQIGQPLELPGSSRKAWSPRAHGEDDPRRLRSRLVLNRVLAADGVAETVKLDMLVTRSLVELVCGCEDALIVVEDATRTGSMAR